MLHAAALREQRARANLFRARPGRVSQRLARRTGTAPGRSAAFPAPPQRRVPAPPHQSGRGRAGHQRHRQVCPVRRSRRSRSSPVVSGMCWSSSRQAMPSGSGAARNCGGGAERDDAEPSGFQQEPQRIAHRRVVVHDPHQRGGARPACCAPRRPAGEFRRRAKDCMMDYRDDWCLDLGQGAAGFPPSRSMASTMRTNSARLRAPIFSITRARCTSTVRGLVPRS